jgi:hypothetical protein
MVMAHRSREEIEIIIADESDVLSLELLGASPNSGKPVARPLGKAGAQRNDRHE